MLTLVQLCREVGLGWQEDLYFDLSSVRHYQGAHESGCHRFLWFVLSLNLATGY